MNLGQRLLIILTITISLLSCGRSTEDLVIDSVTQEKMNALFATSKVYQDFPSEAQIKETLRDINEECRLINGKGLTTLIDSPVQLFKDVMRDHGNSMMIEYFKCFTLGHIAIINAEILENQNFIQSAESNSSSLSHDQKLRLLMIMIDNDVIKGRPSQLDYTYLEITERVKQRAQKIISDGQESKYLTKKNIDLLKKRNLPIPASLVMAQIARESTWGRSSWAVNDRNPLGLQTAMKSSSSVLKKKYCRPAGFSPKICVNRFVSIHDAIREYFHRLNTIKAYRSAQVIRQNDINRGVCPSGYKMIEGLGAYATDKAYIRGIQGLITDYRLDVYDQLSCP